MKSAFKNILSLASLLIALVTAENDYPIIGKIILNSRTM